MAETINACFIVDDVPANATYWMRAQQEAFGYEVPDTGWGKGWRELKASPKFRVDDAAAFADLIEQFGLRGKFTLLPCPAGQGRIDGHVNLFEDDELARLLEIVRERIAPSFDITPEVLTHSMAYDPYTGAMGPHTETAYLSYLAATRQMTELASYLRSAYMILHEAGFTPHGMTCGAMGDPSGVAGGKSLLAGHGRDAFGEAILQIEREFDPMVESSFMFTGSEPTTDAGRGLFAPETVYSADDGRVFEIHSLADPAHPAMHGRADIDTAVDRLITADGTAGEWIDHIETGAAFVLTTHGQTLNALNTGQGLALIRTALTRLRDRYGDRLAWRTTTELCQEMGV